MEESDFTLIENSKARDVFRVEIENILNFHDSTLRLMNDLDKFEEALQIGLSKNPFINKELALKLYKTSKQLLEFCKENRGASYIPYVLAAVSYFIKDDDAQSDFDEIDGFDDDQEVVNFVIKKFKLQNKISLV